MNNRAMQQSNPFDDDDAILDDTNEVSGDLHSLRSPTSKRRVAPMTKTRSMSDSGGTPINLSPSPFILEATRKASKDDSDLGASSTTSFTGPSTPRRPNVPLFPGGLSIHTQPNEVTPPPSNTNSNQYTNPAPSSPKLDHSMIYASPTNILPRRSRGLDFTRHATSLHHSTLAEQSSPESSPSVGNRRTMSISSRRSNYGGPEQSSNSLWSVMGNQERAHLSSSLGSANIAVASDTSSSSDDQDSLDEDMDDAFVTTPHVTRTGMAGASGPNGTLGSPAMGSLMSFQQRQRHRKQPRKKLRGPMGLGGQTRSPPNGLRSRRESITWQANQLHISSRDSEDGQNPDADGLDGPGHVIRRAVTRRGNMLPKTKTFSRIRAALMEEGAPAEAETVREAEVIKQVRESDVEPERRVPPALSEQSTMAGASSGFPSPNLNDDLHDIPSDDMVTDLATGLSNSFRLRGNRFSKGRNLWDSHSETGSVAGRGSTPPPMSRLPRGSSSGMSEDNGVDSPAGYNAISQTASNNSQPPSAAEISRKVNNKRRRDDDLDPLSFKRRAVSPGMSVHNSPIVQSPMQRDVAPWGSRPESNGGDRDRSSAASESGSTAGNSVGPSTAVAAAATSGGRPAAGSGANGRTNGKGRVGFQGMVDTHDGIMRMSIE